MRRGRGHAADGPGKSEDAPADGPGNSANAPGHADDAQGGAVVDQGASLSQEAGASASAEQRDVDNTSIAVHIDQPGDGIPVGQEDRARADAAASTSAAVESAGQAKVQQDAQADASAAQSGVSNTSIVVRVGSPGDGHGVSQANLATGIASASATAGPGDAYGAEVARATATQEGATNTAVSVRVFSPGDDGPVDQINAALASTSTGGADGTENAGAQQDGVRNTSVSIRVESPGSSGPVAQQSESNAVVSAGDLGDRTAVNVTSDAVDTVLTVAVAGSNLERPGTAGLVIWEWTWTWQRDESEGLGDPTGIAVSPGTGIGTTRAPQPGVGAEMSHPGRRGDDDVGLQAGSWEWSWQWTREGVAGLVVALEPPRDTVMQLVRLDLELDVDMGGPAAPRNRHSRAASGCHLGFGPRSRAACRCHLGFSGTGQLNSVPRHGRGRRDSRCSAADRSGRLGARNAVRRPAHRDSTGRSSPRGRSPDRCHLDFAWIRRPDTVQRRPW